MFEGVFFGIFTVLVLLGVVSISYYIILKVLHPKSAGKYIVLIPADGRKKDIASLMYAEKLRMSLLGDKCCVVALDRGLNDKELEVCKRMCADSDGMYICSAEQLDDLIFQEGL